MSKASKRSLHFNISDDDDNVVVVTKKKAERNRKRPSVANMDTTKKRKKTANQTTYSSPRKKESKVVVVTPAKEGNSPEEYVPKHIHKNVDYKRMGNTELSKVQTKLVQWITQHYDIPSDLEQNRKFGPLSGSCYEERMISAYSLDLLKPLCESDISVICTSCADEGHSRDSCPQLL